MSALHPRIIMNFIDFYFPPIDASGYHCACLQNVRTYKAERDVRALGIKKEKGGGGSKYYRNSVYHIELHIIKVGRLLSSITHD